MRIEENIKCIRCLERAKALGVDKVQDEILNRIQAQMIIDHTDTINRLTYKQLYGTTPNKERDTSTSD